MGRLSEKERNHPRFDSCLFLTIWAYHGYTKKQTVIRYLLVLMPYGLSLMSKPMLVTLPFILLLMDFWPLRRLHLPEPASRKRKKGKRPTAEEKPGSSASSLVLEKLPFLGLALMCTLAVSFLRMVGEPFLGFQMRPLTLRIANALVSYVTYLGQTIWPMNLAAFYPFPRSLPSWQVAGAALLLAVISLGAIRSASRRPYFLVGWLWYLVTLLPVIGLVQWGLWPAMADRFTYVPLIGISIIAAWGIPEIIGRWKHKEVILAASGGAAVLSFSVFTWFQISQWQNGITLFTRTLDVTDNNYIAHNNLGAAFSEAIRHKPEFAEAHYNLGIANARLGKTREAASNFSEALRINPGFIEAGKRLETLQSNTW
jgi:hypothetical protein